MNNIDYKYIENAFKNFYKYGKSNISKYSNLVIDHSGIWEGINDIDIKFNTDENELEITITLNGTFLDFPILDIDHQLIANTVIWPWIEKAFLKLFNIYPLKDFNIVHVVFIDSDGDEDYITVGFK